ncbi:cytochrome c oxidase subunit 3 [Flavobacterium kingsejongi]|uniref:Cytochrome oxidase subunit III n=1 Tax=Flavobacterium kingsejongi TaxID=1678728 RepID=A0A2S1LJV6_9FLAO|nr:cytochrome c oxidase subunit 3 [Flavobacterium kingsejongi]AWG24022.1 cytochrome oxidase subunit III [Flavobacterium kingsejongi]
MEMTIKEHNDRKNSSLKMILWFGIMSMSMLFAGLTSAYVVSKSRPDWLKDLEMPSAFLASTIVIIISSVTFMLAKKAIKQDKRSLTTTYLLLTLGLGLSFVYLQLMGFSQLVANGYNLTGTTSNVKISFLYIFVIVHFLHLFGGLISLLVIIYNHFKQKYNSRQTLGIELGAIFWHFLDILWVYLFLFLYFIK